MSCLTSVMAAQASTLYRCMDASGAVLYTNQKAMNRQCTVLSVRVPRAPAGTSVGAPATVASAGPLRTNAVPPAPTPADFPRVSNTEQRSRDTDRRAILESELANERSNLENARKQAQKDSIALHERNIEALSKEMSKLR
jgi:hypothetical protein